MTETTIREYSTELAGTKSTETAATETAATETAATETAATTSRATTCPECDGRIQEDAAHAERVCVSCGLVVDEEAVDRGPEWRAFDAAEKDRKSRVGAPTTKLLHDEGLSSVIDWRNTDAYGNSLNSRQRRKMHRLRTWDERFRTRDHSERNLKQALGEIERMGSALGLPDDVRETASVIYRRALEEDLLPGRSIEGVATASIYAAARQLHRPRSIDEVAAVSRVDEMEFKRTYRYINRELGLAVEPADPLDFIERILDGLDVGDETRYRARELLRESSGTAVFNGKSPIGLAAAAIYAAGQLTGDAPTQDAIAEAADVSTVTIRNRYTELLDAAGAE